MEPYRYHYMNARGHIERVEYLAFDREGAPYPKYANVYVPFGYDCKEAYDILYLMHGSEGNPDEWLDDSKVKNMLDYSIASGRCRPLLVVFPTFYTEFDVSGRDNVAVPEYSRTLLFQKELSDRLMPAVESRFHTFAPAVTPDGFRASRDHRAFGGFSMGSATTWGVFVHHHDFFSCYLNLSGDCWEVAPMGGATATEETVRLLRDTAVSAGPCRFFLATGTKDIACRGLTQQFEEMQKYPDVFRFSQDYARGNLHFLLAEGEDHEYGAMCSYVYHFLPYVFPK